MCVGASCGPGYAMGGGVPVEPLDVDDSQDGFELPEPALSSSPPLALSATPLADETAEQAPNHPAPALGRHMSAWSGLWVGALGWASTAAAAAGNTAAAAETAVAEFVASVGPSAAVLEADAITVEAGASLGAGEAVTEGFAIGGPVGALVVILSQLSGDGPPSAKPLKVGAPTGPNGERPPLVGFLPQPGEWRQGFVLAAANMNGSDRPSASAGGGGHGEGSAPPDAASACEPVPDEPLTLSDLPPDLQLSSSLPPQSRSVGSAVPNAPAAKEEGSTPFAELLQSGVPDQLRSTGEASFELRRETRALRTSLDTDLMAEELIDASDNGMPFADAEKMLLRSPRADRQAMSKLVEEGVWLKEMGASDTVIAANRGRQVKLADFIVNTPRREAYVGAGGVVPLRAALSPAEEVARRAAAAPLQTWQALGGLVPKHGESRRAENKIPALEGEIDLYVPPFPGSLTLPQAPLPKPAPMGDQLSLEALRASFEDDREAFAAALQEGDALYDRNASLTEITAHQDATHALMMRMLEKEGQLMLLESPQLSCRAELEPWNPQGRNIPLDELMTVLQDYAARGNVETVQSVPPESRHLPNEPVSPEREEADSLGERLRLLTENLHRSLEDIEK